MTAVRFFLMVSLWIAPVVSVSAAEPATTPASTASEPVGKTRYRSGKDLNFEELLIQGQLKRPEISVVTGNAGQGDEGLLRLRENFLDRVAVDSGEEIR